MRRDRGSRRLTAVGTGLVLVVALTALVAAQASTTAAAPDPASATPSSGVQLVRAAALLTHSKTATVSLHLAASKVLGASTTVTGNGMFDFTRASGVLQLRQPGGTERVIFLPSSVFVKPPGTGSRGLPSGKRWISAGLTEYPAIQTNLPQFVLQVEGLNPAFLLDEVAWGVVSTSPLGDRTVDGATVKGFVAKVNLTTAGAHARGPAAAAFARSILYELQALGASGSSASGATQQVRLWIDSTGRIVELQASPPGSGVGTTSVTLSAFGVPVHVSIPAKGLIVDIVALTPGGERENNGGGDTDGA